MARLPDRIDHIAYGMAAAETLLSGLDTHVHERASVRGRAFPGVQDRAVAVHHTDTSAEAWDAAANVARLESGEDAAYYRRMYAWQDPDADATTKGAYKFPHHHVDADGEPGAAVMAGCSAGIAVLNGGRGGADIPDADRPGVYAHLKAHLEDGDRTAPPLQDYAVAARRPRAVSRRPWYRIQDQEQGDVAELWIYDEISGWGVSAAEFVRDLQRVRAAQLTLHLNSPGGDIWEGWAIYTALKTHPGTVEVRVDSLAASVAAVIAMAGDTIVMAKPSTLMIHDPWGMTVGDARDHRSNAALLDKFGDQIAQVFADRAGGSAADWRALMLAETWYDEREAVAAGLADQVAGAATVAANQFDLSIFSQTPAAFVGSWDTGGRRPPGTSQAPSKREVEAALRDAGLSAAGAKALLARGWVEEDAARDADALRLLLGLRQLRA